jgi:hypothetical protein
MAEAVVQDRWAQMKRYAARLRWALGFPKLAPLATT